MKSNSIRDDSCRLLLAIECEKELKEYSDIFFKKLINETIKGDEDDWKSHFRTILVEHNNTTSKGRMSDEHLENFINNCISKTITAFYELDSFDDVVGLFIKTNEFSTSASSALKMFSGKYDGVNSYNLNEILNHFHAKMSDGTMSNFDYNSDGSLPGYLYRTFVNHYLPSHSSFVSSILNEKGTGETSDGRLRESLVAINDESVVKELDLDFPVVIRDIYEASKVLFKYENTPNNVVRCQYDIFSAIMSNRLEEMSSTINESIKKVHSQAFYRPHAYNVVYSFPETTNYKYKIVNEIIQTLELNYDLGIHVDSLPLLYRLITGLYVNYQHNKSKVIFHQLIAGSKAREKLKENRDRFLVIQKGYVSARKLADYVLANNINFTSEDLDLFRTNLHFPRFKSLNDFLELGSLSRLLHDNISNLDNSIQRDQRTNDNLYYEVINKPVPTGSKEKFKLDFNLANLASIVKSQTINLSGKSDDETKVNRLHGAHLDILPYEYYMKNVYNRLLTIEDELGAEKASAYVMIREFLFNTKYMDTFNTPSGPIVCNVENIRSFFVNICSNLYPSVLPFAVEVLQKHYRRVMGGELDITNVNHIYGFLFDNAFHVGTSYNLTTSEVILKRYGDIEVCDFSVMAYLARIVSFKYTYLASSSYISTNFKDSDIDSIEESLLPLDAMRLVHNISEDYYNLLDTSVSEKLFNDTVRNPIIKNLDKGNTISNPILKFDRSLREFKDLIKLTTPNGEFCSYMSHANQNVNITWKTISMFKSIFDKEYEYEFRELDDFKRKFDTKVSQLGLSFTIENLPDNVKRFSTEYTPVETLDIADERDAERNRRLLQEVAITKQLILDKVGNRSNVFRSGFLFDGLHYVKCNILGKLDPKGDYYIHCTGKIVSKDYVPNQPVLLDFIN